MYNLQGIIRKGITNTEVQFEKLGYVSSNIANLNTVGYKNVRFEQVLNEDGYLNGVVRTNHETGIMYRTKRDLDVAINGYGFIPITSTTGEIAYTRDGSFRIGKDGYLFTNNGDLVGDGIQIPVNYKEILIQANGNVEVRMDKSEEAKLIGKIPVVAFQNPEGLKEVGGNKFIATNDSGEPVLQKDHEFIKQGFTETANTNVYDSISDVLRLNASMLAGFKVMKMVDEMYTKSINLTE